jgi:NTP pyrophosphatase (non-canonical NTP hydrolase)
MVIQLGLLTAVSLTVKSVVKKQNLKMSKEYILYHIPGKKIGCTTDLYNRVTDQQGYEPGEYEVLEKSNDIDYISKRELQLQEEYGYRVDRVPYNKLNNNNFNNLKTMKINVTDQTTTFPCPVSKLKGNLMDNLEMSWKTIEGTVWLDERLAKWIVDNAKTSMYNDNRCYVYNRAMVKFYMKHPEVMLENCSDPEDCCQHEDDIPTIFDLIRFWAKDKGIYDKGDQKTQYVKLMEEAGEVGRAILKNDILEIQDGIGDMVVVLTNLAELSGLSIEECIESAYDVIAKRKGKMINGTFVKNN